MKKIMPKVLWTLATLVLLVGMSAFWVYAIESKDLGMLMCFGSGLFIGPLWAFIWTA